MARNKRDDYSADIAARVETIAGKMGALQRAIGELSLDVAIVQTFTRAQAEQGAKAKPDKPA